MRSSRQPSFQLSVQSPRHPVTKQSGGFSLIEILVVISIIAVIAGMVVLSIGEDPRRSVQDEAQRLHALLVQAKEEAILQGQIHVLQMKEDGYEFLQPNDEGKLQTAMNGLPADCRSIALTTSSGRGPDIDSTNCRVSLRVKGAS